MTDAQSSKTHAPLTELRDAIRSRSLSAAEATQRALTRAHASHAAVNAYTQIFDDEATAQARSIDERLARGEPVGPLAGVPIAIKDNLCLAWGKTTCASRMLEDYRSPYSATSVQRLLDAGAVIIGKTNLDEFAMGSSTERSIFGPTRNPWDTSRVPGGSSGGSAAAVADGSVTGALGSDTGGSIRQPGGMCNLVGYKPTYGRVSRYGLVAYASSLDQVGPLTRSVADAALLAQVISGEDKHDATSLSGPGPDLLGGLERPVEGLTIGVPIQARSVANHSAVTAALEAAVAAYRAQGATIVEVDLAHADQAIAAYYVIAPAEASSNLARFDGVRYGRRAKAVAGEGLTELYERSRSEGFGPEVQRRILLGTHVLSSGYYDAYYATAQKVRRLIRKDFDDAFAPAAARPACHALLMPTAPSPAFRIGEKTSDPLALYLEDVYTVGINLAGLPAISVPAGFANVGGRDLPVGMQLVGPMGDDATLLRVAWMLERGMDAGRRIASAL
ncbi:MAG: Asp-tRNA(Asn)/Glu-tRNA(Gln) amidotransferase subunit GatA [Phycisphaerales bacterium]|nr:Asp-tRNA(Asn)/Glu-tRNA(Gln) amidotransferase subunit GatA [Phycisphaerales bacterium]